MLLLRQEAPAVVVGVLRLQQVRTAIHHLPVHPKETMVETDKVLPLLEAVAEAVPVKQAIQTEFHRAGMVLHQLCLAHL